MDWNDPTGLSAEEVEEIDEGSNEETKVNTEIIEKRVECMMQTVADTVDLVSSPDIGTLFSFTYDLASYKAALKKIHDKVGRLPKGKPSKYGSPQAGDTKKGYRLDPGHPNRPPDNPESGPHFNWWDYTNGKRGRGGDSGSIPIE